jgi:hypothetical protein
MKYCEVSLMKLCLLLINSIIISNELCKEKSKSTAPRAIKGPNSKADDDRTTKRESKEGRAVLNPNAIRTLRSGKRYDVFSLL